MVTRVDKKPIIYNTCLLRVARPSVVSQRKDILQALLDKSVGHAIPKVQASSLVYDYEDIENLLHLYGLNDPAFSFDPNMVDEDENECIEMARSMIRYEENIRRALKSNSVMDNVARMQKKIFEGCDRIYHGTEAVYAFFSEFRTGNIVASPAAPPYKDWVSETTQRMVAVQAPYMFIHPSAALKVVNDVITGIGHSAWREMSSFKVVESMALRLFSKRNLAAHASLYGIGKRGFEQSPNPLDDFEVKMRKEHSCAEDLKIYVLLGIKYICTNRSVYCLTADDSVNLASMAQCFFRNALYFTPGNGYPVTASRDATTLVDQILCHCRRLIDCRKNFSHAIRALHILAQGDFNDIYEKELGMDLGWRGRSANYIEEARSLDACANTFHRRAMALARTPMDRLNVGFIYHCFVGDEMLIKDLKDKVTNMPKKVRAADKVEWARFINFCKAYFLCRFMMVNKRKPKVAGAVELMNDQWAARCVSGNFTMPPQADWGRVWISKEFSYTKYADTWHLDAQDVSYVVKDTAGLVAGKYQKNRVIHSELLMAMTSGNVLDIITHSTPASARARIISGTPCTEVAVTTAPKAENAKPSWKKRVTFAADCEFRKMQSEYDKNTRKVMGFVRGPSLGIDQTILEKQFADIALATQSGVSGGICSHDISAWSESMDRDRKFEFEKVLIDMLNMEGMDNIKLDWAKIKAVVSKQGNKSIIPLTNGSFQGFDGSASTLLHSMILLYCVDTARRENVMGSEVKANMATLIDDCIALMNGLTNVDEANKFWAHLKDTYLKLGFEVDDLKSIFSTIKAIYLSRRFLCGAEVPADYKVFVKTHMSYEDPLRCAMDAPSDIFGAMRGATDANGDAWYMYTIAVLSTLSEIAYYNPKIVKLPPAGAAVFCLAPGAENGWGLPSMVDWATNDVTDKRSHFNAIFEKAASYTTESDIFKRGFEIFTRSTGQALMAIKSQAWRMVSVSNIFTNPFEAIREGPLKPDMLRRNAVQDLLRDVATAEPWVGLLGWNVSYTTERVRQFLVSSGPLHAPTLAALVNCMPDNYRLSLVGKAVGSQSLLDLLPKGRRSNLKRRVSKCSQRFFDHSLAIFQSVDDLYLADDFAVLTYTERTTLEREEFYTANGVEMIDHTFPDPVGSFTNTAIDTGSFIAPNLSSITAWDRISMVSKLPKDMFSGRGLYVPRKSSRVWEVTSEFARGWDTVSQRIAMGLAVLSRAEADGHGVKGLLSYFIKSWNEVSNITPDDTHLISIHGSIKRLDSNPGSANHPVIVHRNLLRGINFNIKTALDAIPTYLTKTTGSSHNLHDFLAHETAMLTVTTIQLCAFMHLNVADDVLKFRIATRPDCIVPESSKRMTTDCVFNKINVEIMESADNYGLLQSCPELAEQIAIPTMKASWVRMINALINNDEAACEALIIEAQSTNLEDLLAQLEDEVAVYSVSVVTAAEPALRGRYEAVDLSKFAIEPAAEPASSKGDSYTMSVRPVQSKFTRTLSRDQPDYLASAVVIRSIIWERLKSKKMITLASIYYDDPDVTLDDIAECASEKFWKAIIVEVAKTNRKKPTSELLMQGFRSLGVAGIHINATSKVEDLCHSVASFFGANLKQVVKLIGDQILSVAGRSQADFEKPFLQRVITNNPTMANIRLRKAHLTNLIKFNLEQLTNRIDKLGSDEMTHRGDKRMCTTKDRMRQRLVELRCRKYVYMHIKINEAGEAVLDEEAHGAFIRKCAVNVATKFKIDESEIPQAATTFQGVLDYTDEIGRFFGMHEKTKKENHGWFPVSGNLGARYALDQILSDSEQVSSTRFAVSAAEIAPRMYKRITVCQPATHCAEEEQAAEVSDIFSADAFSFLGGFGGRDITIDDVDDVDPSEFFRADLPSGSLEKWKKLYTLLYTHAIEASTANAAFGLKIGDSVTLEDLRVARLDELSDEVITAAMPTIDGEYLACGVAFDDEWLDRDDAAAYTTDESSTRRTVPQIRIA